MSFFDCKDEYSVNIREIDEQHKKLVSLLNNLHEALMAGEGRQASERVLTELVTYTESHFATEERLMQRYHYPEYLEHKRKHEKMKTKVLAYVEMFKEEKLKTTLELKTFLKSWLGKHIMQTDKKYGPFLNDKGVR